MSIITKEMLDNGKDKEPIEGEVLFKDYSFALTKNNKEYIQGSLQSGKMIPYKVWHNDIAFEKIKNSGIVNQVCKISGEFNDFNDTVSIIIKDIEVVPNADIGIFLESRYDGDKYLESLKHFCQQHLSVKGYTLMDAIFFGDADLIDRFKTEFAAMSHHDNCKAGLIAHTCKVLKITSCILATYKNLTIGDNGLPDQDKIDLVYIGALLHDIGKIDEMRYGVYVEGSFVTHRIIGLEYILKFKDLFLQNYSEMWFKYLEAIIMQHHNEYGEHCKTVYSYIVHLADDLESDLALIDQMIPDAPVTPVGKTIKPRNNRLNFI